MRLFLACCALLLIAYLGIFGVSGPDRDDRVQFKLSSNQKTAENDQDIRKAPTQRQVVEADDFFGGKKRGRQKIESSLAKNAADSKSGGGATEEKNNLAPLVPLKKVLEEKKTSELNADDKKALKEYLEKIPSQEIEVRVDTLMREMVGGQASKEQLQELYVYSFIEDSGPSALNERVMQVLAQAYEANAPREGDPEEQWELFDEYLFPAYLRAKLRRSEGRYQIPSEVSRYLEYDDRPHFEELKEQFLNVVRE